MSRFAKTKRTPILTDAELEVMPFEKLRMHAKESDRLASLLASVGARAMRVYKRRKRAEAKRA